MKLDTTGGLGLELWQDQRLLANLLTINRKNTLKTIPICKKRLRKN